MAKREQAHTRRVIARLLFLLYSGLMIWLLFVQRMDHGGTAVEQNWNFTPLKTLKLYCELLSSGDGYLVRHAVINLVGNVIMFIPLGFFLPVVWETFCVFWRCVACVLALIVLIESVQYLSGLGSCDVDDLLLNLPGAVIGYVLQVQNSRNRR